MLPQVCLQHEPTIPLCTNLSMNEWFRLALLQLISWHWHWQAAVATYKTVQTCVLQCTQGETREPADSGKCLS